MRFSAEEDVPEDEVPEVLEDAAADEVPDVVEDIPEDETAEQAA